jgi:RNA polymerase sigma factor (sigma-70 family)
MADPRMLGMSQYSGSVSSTDHNSEVDPLHADLDVLESLIANPSTDNPTREWATLLVSDIRQAMALNVHFGEVADQFHLRERCQQLSDEEVAKFIALPDEGKESELYRRIGILLKPLIDELGEVSQQEAGKVEYKVCCAFRVALLDEYAFRRAKVEKAPGSSVRKMIVEQDDRERGKCLEQIAQRVIASHHMGAVSLPALAFPQSVGNDSFSTEAREEAHQMAVESLAVQLTELWDISPPAANPKFFVAALDGSFDKSFWRARDEVSENIRKELRHGHSMIEGDAPIPDENNDRMVTLIDATRQKTVPQTLVDQKILFEQLFNVAALSSEERELFVMLVEDRTQEEIAAALDLSQGEVSKTKAKVIAKLRSHLRT